MEKMLISGVAKDTDVARISVMGVPNIPGLAFKMFSKLSAKDINVDIILQSIGHDGKKDISFTVAKNRGEEAVALMKEYTENLGAEEILYPEVFRYLSDLLSYAAVGARSSEDQLHRMIASGVGIPVGMKNPTSGDLSVMLNSVAAAQHEQEFLFRGWEVRTKGNPLAHSILRGYVDPIGNSFPNYHYEVLKIVIDMYAERQLQNPAIIVDTNQAISGKKYLEQIRIAKDIVHSRKLNSDINRIVKGLMIESYIEDGAQGVHDGVYGKSITDPCLGWEKTERLLLDLAEEL